MSDGAEHNPLLGRYRPPGHRWIVALGIDEFPYLADHRIQGKVVLPGSVYLEMALSAATAVGGGAPAILRDVRFERAFIVPEQGTRELEVVLSRGVDGWDFAAAGVVSGIRHASLNITTGNQQPTTNLIDPADSEWEGGSEIAGEVLYQRLREVGNDFGPAFRRLHRYWRSAHGVVGVLNLQATNDSDGDGSLTRTAMLDTVMQALVAAADVERNAFALVGCERVELHGAPVAAGRVYARLRQHHPPEEVLGDALFIDDSGRPIVALTGVRLRCLPLPQPAGIKIAVAATFTAEPIRSSLEFWSSAFDFPASVEIAPYNQPFQQLLDPSSSFSTNPDGVNVLLLRLEDLARAGTNPQEPADLGDHPRFRLPGLGEIAHLVTYETEFLYDEIFLRRAYLRHGVELPDDACVFDVGANIGMFTLFVRSQCRNPKIYAFEPGPPIYHVLRANASAHARDAKLFDFGLGDREEARPFTFYRNSPAFSSFTADPDRDRAAVEAVARNLLRPKLRDGSADLEPLVSRLTRDRLEREVHPSRTRTLSSVLREHDVDRIDLLKIDAEGSEARILAGIDEQDWPRIRQLVIEVHDESAAAAMRASLEQRDFQVVVDTSDGALRGTGFAHLFARRREAAGWASPSPARHDQLDQNVDELLHAIEASRAQVPLLVCLCPSWTAQAERRLVDGLSRIPNITVLTSADLTRSYRVGDDVDPYADRLGHVPYTARFFAALGTLLFRHCLAMRRSPLKVLALDCDDTLWTGVCGEDGPEGVVVDAGRRALQEFVVRLNDAGVLVSLCSRNHPMDVCEVFARRTDMPLRLDHLASWRFNWEAKADNLVSISEELGLGLESFAFIDNDPVECTRMRAEHPEVLTLCLPVDPARIADFVGSLWAFDRFTVTAEDETRAARHRQERRRRALRESAMTLASFMASLELRVVADQFAPADLARVAQLTQRTNQFNTSGIRRSEVELRDLIAAGELEGRTFRVQDRFGDYGLVGAVWFAVAGDTLRADSFLLSCRALGRGVEHQMVALLGRIAIDRGLSRIEIPFVPSPRNEPARRFLQSIGQSLGSGKRGGAEPFVIAAPTAAALVFDPSSARFEGAPVAQPAQVATAPSELYQRIATELADVDAILAAVERERFRRRPALDNEVIAPNDELERNLVRLWQRVLAVGEVGIDDNFFELGGTSLSAVEIIARLSEEMGFPIPTTSVFEHATIRSFANMLRQRSDATGQTGQRRGERRRAWQLGTRRPRPDDG